MSRSEYPTAPSTHFKEFLARSADIESQRLTDAIPKGYYTPQEWRGLLGFAVSGLLYIGAIVGVAFAPHWALYPPLWIAAGTGGWGLVVIGHDAAHGSFSRNRRLNVAIGHVSMLPLLWPYHAWRHVHNMHHASTNHLELDPDWRPVSIETFKKMPLPHKFFYWSARTWMFWGATIRYWSDSAFRPDYYPKATHRRDVKRSITFVVGMSVLYFGGLVYVTGWQGVLLYFVAPWLVIHMRFSVTTLMNHSASDIPYLTTEHWTRNASRLLVTTDYVYPKWLLFLTHNISIHTAHHVSPVTPFYNLPKAQRALKERYPGMVREEVFSFRKLWDILRNLHCYDTELGFYSDFSGSAVPLKREAGSQSADTEV